MLGQGIAVLSIIIWAMGDVGQMMASVTYVTYVVYGMDIETQTTL